jgi:hypothetical protein
MAMGHNAQGGFGYPLHRDERRGEPVDMHGVATIPQEAKKLIDRCGEQYLTPDQLDECQRSIESAKRELFERHIAKLRSQSGGNRYLPDGQPARDEEDDGDDA